MRNQIRRAKGTSAEVALIEAELGYGPIYVTSLLLIGITGILMSTHTGLGFFQVSWLGVKQAIFLYVFVVTFAYITPRAIRMRRRLRALESHEQAAPEDVRALLYSGWRVNNLVDLGTAVNVVLAVWKPL